MPKGRMDKQNVVHPYREYYSAIKRNQALIGATMWINLENIKNKIKQNKKLENIMLSGRSRILKQAIYCIILFIRNVQTGKSIATESGLWLPGAGGRGRWGVTDCSWGWGFLVR